MMKVTWIKTSNLFPAIVIFCVISCLWFIRQISNPSSHSHWPALDTSPSITASQECVPHDIEDLPALIEKSYDGGTCRDEFANLARVILVEKRCGDMVIDAKEFETLMRGWLDKSTDFHSSVLHQCVISVYNKYTKDEVIYNPLRAKRPNPYQVSSELEEIEKLYKQTKESCDLCRFDRYTAHDPAGRLTTHLSFTAANAFRYEARQQMVMPRHHHPLNWSGEQFVDMFNLSHTWAEREYSRDVKYSFPMITWDLLPPSGASQIHPHLQVILTPTRYPGNAERWRQAAQDYYKDHKRNYFTDLISAHDSLGLTVRYKSAVAIATLTPWKEKEVVVIGDTMSVDYLLLLHSVIRAYIDDMQSYSLSLAMVLPQFSSQSAVDARMPVVTRIITRSKVGSVRSDVSALEFFTFSNVISDPFNLIKILRKSVDKRL